MKLLKIQTSILLLGVLFSWFTVFSDFYRFYNIYGSLTKIKDCEIPNPITTPCFYGAFAFLFAFILAFQIVKESNLGKVITATQSKLWYLLLAGTIFAWGNFLYGVYRFYTTTSQVKVSCSGIPTENAFLTPCFYGAIIFLISLVIAQHIKARLSKAVSDEFNK